MRKLLLTTLFTLLLCGQTLSQDLFAIYHLKDLLTEREHRWFANQFPRVPVNDIQLVVMPVDGKGGTLAYVSLTEDNPSTVIFLDAKDWYGIPFDERGFLMRYRVAALVLVHEMIHVDQTHRGLTWRQRMIHQHEFWDYAHRPFEVEAYAVSEIMMQRFPKWK